jgi:PAS domain-containing protein
MVMNVVEDARIERMIKDTYPGLRRDFYHGYKSIFEMDLFGIADRKINDLPFIDRLNLFTKVGNIMHEEIEFTQTEQKLVDEVQSTFTFDDVIDLSCRIFQMIQSEHDSLELNICKILPRHLAEQQLDFAHLAIETGTLQIFEQIVDFPDERRYEEVRIAPLNNQEVLMIIRDISDRKKTEIALRESEEFNRQLITEFPIGLASCRLDGQLVYINSNFAQILGRTVEETLNLT